MDKKPYLVFGSSRELTFFLALLDKFLGLKLGRVTPLLEPVRSCGMETYSWHAGGQDSRAVSLVSTTKEIKRKLPTQETSVCLHLCDEKGQELEITGNISFFHSQKIIASFKVFYKETSDSILSFLFRRLTIRVHAMVRAHMEECSDAQTFAQESYDALKKMEGEEDLPF